MVAQMNVTPLTGIIMGNFGDCQFLIRNATLGVCARDGALEWRQSADSRRLRGLGARRATAQIEK
jgi:hypothetical protein